MRMGGSLRLTTFVVRTVLSPPSLVPTNRKDKAHLEAPHPLGHPQSTSVAPLPRWRHRQNRQAEKMDETELKNVRRWFVNDYRKYLTIVYRQRSVSPLQRVQEEHMAANDSLVVVRLELDRAHAYMVGSSPGFRCDCNRD